MAYNKASMLFSCILLLLLALTFSMGESKVTFHTRFTVQGTLVCNEIYGTQVGDTCFSIIEAFHLTASTFNTFNPNLNCQKVFVGEWLCINGMVV
ncbi:unnamed protein product [Lactuca virosa]|uniref:LysM domain-containing protein n=1 Tax=Lactuca virosa TaxID=75947 RepID=A0AAU9MDD9_9ASTR|nr:unnamed protein product [Lactuca virosa]